MMEILSSYAAVIVQILVTVYFAGVFVGKIKTLEISTKALTEQRAQDSEKITRVETKVDILLYERKN